MNQAEKPRGIDEWFPDFVEKIQSRIRRSDWPNPHNEDGQEYWSDFASSVRRTGATEAIADEASSIVADQPDLFLNQIRSMVKAEIHNIFARLNAENKAANGGPTTLEQALHHPETKACKKCGGNGLATLYVHSDILGFVKTPRGNVFPVGTRFTMVCDCPLGLEMEKNDRHAGADHKSGLGMPSKWAALIKDPRYRMHPDNWDGMHNKPMPGFEDEPAPAVVVDKPDEEGVRSSRGAINALFASRTQSQAGHQEALFGDDPEE